MGFKQRDQIYDALEALPSVGEANPALYIDQNVQKWTMRYTDLWDTIKKKAQSTDNLLTLPTVNEVLSSTDIDDYLNNLALLDRPKWSDYLESR
jgi:hypothetical protein